MVVMAADPARPQTNSRRPTRVGFMEVSRDVEHGECTAKSADAARYPLPATRCPLRRDDSVALKGYTTAGCSA